MYNPNVNFPVSPPPISLYGGLYLIPARYRYFVANFRLCVAAQPAISGCNSRIRVVIFKKTN